MLRQIDIFGTPTSYPNVPLETRPFPSPPTSMLIYLGQKYTVEHMTILSNIGLGERGVGRGEGCLKMTANLSDCLNSFIRDCSSWCFQPCPPHIYKCKIYCFGL